MLQRVDDIKKLGEGRSLVFVPELARVDMIVFETRRILQAGSGRAADFHRERFGGRVASKSVMVLCKRYAISGPIGKLRKMLF